MHQLSSIQYQCRNSSNFSQRLRNNLCMQELYKLFDWHVFQAEQAQATATSVLERQLHQTPKDLHIASTDTHKLLGKDSTIETLFPDPHYTIEKHMPLVSTPQLDLYFTPSILVTLSLLLTACVEYISKSDSEYCLISLTRRPKSVTPEPLSADKPGKKRRKLNHEES